MSRNSRSLFCAACNNPLEADGTCKMCPAGSPRRAHGDRIDRLCPWNDHGMACGLVGSLSDPTNGSGPWYCSRHWWKLKGYPEKVGTEHVSYREQWYKDRGLPYEQPNLEGTAHLRQMAQGADALYARLFGGELGPRRMREPGED